eukprot:gene10541-biopygen1064
MKLKALRRGSAECPISIQFTGVDDLRLAHKMREGVWIVWHRDGGARCPVVATLYCGGPDLRRVCNASPRTVGAQARSRHLRRPPRVLPKLAVSTPRAPRWLGASRRGRERCHTPL